MKRIHTVITILIVINFSLITAGLALLNTSTDQLETPEANTDTNYFEVKKGAGSRGSRAIDANGGSWLDSFDDNSKIDTSRSDKYLVTNSAVGINGTNLLDDDTVALWYLNMGTGINAIDATTYNNHGILGGDGLGTDVPVWSAGKIGTGLDFDGFDYVNCGNDASMMPQNEITVEAWIYPKGLPSNVGGIVNKGGYITSSAYGINFINTNEIYCNVYDSVGTRMTRNGGTVPLNTWSYVAFTYHKDDALRMYVNGLEVASTVAIGNPIKTNSLDVYLGNRNTFNYGFNGIIDNARISKVARPASELLNIYNSGGFIGGYKSTANITSEAITVPTGMKWDSLVINKTEPDQSTMDVRIFDGSTGMLIPGSPTYTAEGEFDLSFIDPVLYPSIKLNGTFKNNGKGSPFLKYWGVSWKTQKSWQDTFFMGARVKSSDCVAVDDGSVECSIAQGTSGYLNSSIFTINDQYYYDTLIINKSESVGNSIKVTVYDGDTQVPISGFIDLTGTEIDVSSIDPLSYPKLQLRAVFTSDGVLTPYLYDWSVSWYGNYAPTVKGFQIANDEVYRNSSIMISIDSADFETEESLLEIVVKYQYKGSVLWYDEYIKNLRFDTANWYVDFEPSIFAVIGNYSFQVTVTDEYGEAVSFEFPDAVEVKNNPPGKPEVEITPLKPTSKDALFATASNSPDIENEPITYFYQWYKNNVHQSHLTTEHVSAAETAKGEVWRCEVTPRDSNPDGFGTMNSASVIIRNSAPDVVSPIDTVTMNEDGIDDISINLHTVFSDYDGDTMKFMCSLNEYIKVVVTQSTGMVTLTPVSDWYGITDLTFTANDTEAETEEQISVLVQPVNDAPKLISAGITMITSENEVTRFSVYELSWINLTLKSQDIDGDTVSYSTNRTDYIGTDDISDIVLEGDTLRFKPMNNHVGEIPVQIRLSDSRGGETKYDFIIEVLNTNNPPSVTIVYPLDNMHFSESQAIEFRCEYSDPDLLLEGSEESLFFRWSSNQHFDDLDSGEYKVIIPGLKLKAGIHEIKVTGHHRYVVDNHCYSICRFYCYFTFICPIEETKGGGTGIYTSGPGGRGSSRGSGASAGICRTHCCRANSCGFRAGSAAGYCCSYARSGNRNTASTTSAC
jgi:hypothetical protein